MLQRHDESLRLLRAVYSGFLARAGQSHENTLAVGNNLCQSLFVNNLFREGKQFTRELLRVSKQAYDDMHERPIILACILADGLCHDPAASRADVQEAEALLTDALINARRGHGDEHPRTQTLTEKLARTRELLNMF